MREDGGFASHRGGVRDIDTLVIDVPRPHASAARSCPNGHTFEPWLVGKWQTGCAPLAARHLCGYRQSPLLHPKQPSGQSIGSTLGIIMAARATGNSRASLLPPVGDQAEGGLLPDFSPCHDDVPLIGVAQHFLRLLTLRHVSTWCPARSRTVLKCRDVT